MKARLRIFFMALLIFGWAKKIMSNELLLAAHKGDLPKIKNIMSKLNDQEKIVILNNSDQFGWTALMYAANEGHLEVVKELLKYKHNFDLKTKKEGATALMMASNKGYVAIVKELCQTNTSLDIQDKDGDTALMIAVKNNYVEIVVELLKWKHNFSLKNKRSKPALELAAILDRLEIMKEFFKVNPAYKTNDKILQIAALHGGVNVVKELLNHNPTFNSNVKDKDGLTFLDCIEIRLKVFRFDNKEMASKYEEILRLLSHASDLLTLVTKLLQILKEKLTRLLFQVQKLSLSIQSQGINKDNDTEDESV